MNALKKGEYYTYSDYITWNSDERYELIDGVPYLMSPAPSRKHQRINIELGRQLANFLDGKPCQVYAAPFDVRLNYNKHDDTVVQPDILVVCDKTKLDDRGCNGAPDLVIEILSPTSGKHDRIIKFKKYLEAGVREYWIVDPFDNVVSVYLLTDDKYVINVFDDDAEVIEVDVLEGCIINLKKVFSED